MWDDILDAAVDLGTRAYGEGLDRRQMVFLRLRIWISWMLWVVGLGIIVSALLLLRRMDRFEWLMWAFGVVFAARLLRSYRRPPSKDGNAQGPLYKFTTLLPPGMGFIAGATPTPSVMWLGCAGLVASLYLLYRTQVKDDRKILGAIRAALEREDEG